MDRKNKISLADSRKREIIQLRKINIHRWHGYMRCVPGCSDINSTGRDIEFLFVGLEDQTQVEYERFAKKMRKSFLKSSKDIDFVLRFLKS